VQRAHAGHAAVERDKQVEALLLAHLAHDQSRRGLSEPECVDGRLFKPPRHPCKEMFDPSEVSANVCRWLINRIF
jgi:hypothetical protein